MPAPSRRGPPPAALTLRSELPRAGPGPVLLVTGVLGNDVTKLNKLLVGSGAPGVSVEDADYGQKVVASLAVEQLLGLSPRIADFVRPSGRIGISGIDSADVDKFVSAFSSNFEDMRIEEDEGRTRLTAWRKDPWMVRHCSRVEGRAVVVVGACLGSVDLTRSSPSTPPTPAPTRATGARILVNRSGTGARGHQD